jgi:hypothetical protein
MHMSYNNQAVPRFLYNYQNLSCTIVSLYFGHDMSCSPEEFWMSFHACSCLYASFDPSTCVMNSYCTSLDFLFICCRVCTTASAQWSLWWVQQSNWFSYLNTCWTCRRKCKIAKESYDLARLGAKFILTTIDVQPRPRPWITTSW